mgnify:CR=1 FL=1
MKDLFQDREFREWADKTITKNGGNPNCIICGAYGDHEHHIQYRPEQILAYLCSSCHRRVHDEDGFHDRLKPDTSAKSIPPAERSKLKTRRKNGEAVFISDLSEI